MAELAFVNIREDLISQMAQLELVCFPTANPDELLGVREWEAYHATFPEGVFVAMDGPKVVGVGAGILLDFDFEHPQHSIVSITGEDQCGNHDPAGDWYYGTDITVHPGYRRRGIGHGLYERRKTLVRDLDRRGIIAGGHMPAFADHKAHMSAAEYIERVRAREIYDPTLTFQMENGFELLGVLEDYMHDDATDGWSALIVWHNPDYGRDDDQT
ncbi:MAG TPA: GNAT family N-acetyltransferase [Acidimicrobiia bacterium]